MKKYLVSCTAYAWEEELDCMYTFDAPNVDIMYDKLLQQVESEWKAMGKLNLVYSEPILP